MEESSNIREALTKLLAMVEYLREHGGIREPQYFPDCPYEPTTEGMIIMQARSALALAKGGA
jgi:hypothetical protein